MSLRIPDAYVLYKLLDKLFGKRFITWEQETLEIELIKTKHPTLSRYGKDELVTNMINALRALLSKESYVISEWHLFEKTIAALSGKPVNFFDCQPPGSLHELFLGMELIDAILEVENADYSEEVLLYVGITIVEVFGILDFPFEPYKSAIRLAREITKSDESNPDVFAEYTRMMEKFMADKTRVSTVYKAMLDNPDTDVLEKVESVYLRNIISSVCAYLFVKGQLQESQNDLQDALLDNSKPEIADPSVEEDTFNEGLAEGYSEEVMSFVNAEEHADALLNEKQAAESPFIRREGTYIITDDGDDTGDHTYDGYNSISEPSRRANNGVVSSQESGDAYHRLGPPTQKVISPKDTVSDKKALDALAAVFNELDI